jgi:leucyl/phenylalanyl-tRNA--protein transferase
MPLPRPLLFISPRLTRDPIATLWHYVAGHLLDWQTAPGTPLRWKRPTHRGVQWLHKIQIPRKQKRYIFSPDFQIKYNTAFEQTLRACAAQPRSDENWITEDYIQAMLPLHATGFAHSFEAWQNDQLVGGAFGLQLGSLITCDSMFHKVSNASKAAYGQTLLHLQGRGFKLVDTNGVAQHHVQYGEEWLPQWQFESLIYDCLNDSPTLTNDTPRPPPLPLTIRLLLPILRTKRGIARRLCRV